MTSLVFLSQKQQTSLVTEVDLKNSLDRTNLTDENTTGENSNPTPSTCGSGGGGRGLEDGPRQQLEKAVRGLTVKNVAVESESSRKFSVAAVGKLSHGAEFMKEPPQEDNIAEEKEMCGRTSSSAMASEATRSDDDVTMLEHCQSVSGSSSDGREAVGMPETAAKLPLGEMLSNAVEVEGESTRKKMAVNPFVKLQLGKRINSEHLVGGGSDCYFTSKAAPDSEKKGKRRN